MLTFLLRSVSLKATSNLSRLLKFDVHEHTHTQSEGENYRTDLATQGHRRKQGPELLNLCVYLNDLDLAFQKCVVAFSLERMCKMQAAFLVACSKQLR